MSHFPRMPVRFLEQNNELLKSQAPSGNKPGSSDYSHTEDVAVAHMEAQYNAPGYERVSGNQVFRRYPNGNIDLISAKDTVVDIIHRVKDGGPLTDLDKIILGCMFPLMFPFVDSRLAGPLTRVQLRLAPWEMAMISQKVAAHLAEEMNYNAGLGGGGDPGRSTTRS